MSEKTSAAVTVASHKDSLAYAKEMDVRDPLNTFRDKFFIPKHGAKDTIYLCGNSLGLQPKDVTRYVGQELEDWRNLGVKGHTQAKNPWLYYHHLFTQSLTQLLGTEPTEVVAMNSLTVNLHLLLSAFYQPEGKRCKIIVESDIFPSDLFAVQSQARMRKQNPDDVIVQLKPRAGESCLRHEDVLAKINELNSELSLVFLGGVNYYTGQLFNMAEITKAAHAVGALAGFDLAHAAGNVPLQLHDWKVDFAAWCSYKYLNSGPGGPSGIFVHEKHHGNLNKMEGWWGHDEKTRFDMGHDFVAMEGAPSWQLSNVPILTMAAHLAALRIFDQAGIAQLRSKSIALTGYLEFLLTQKDAKGWEIITPSNPEERGCQLSILTGPEGPEWYKRLTDAGVVADWRKPNVIRVAPVPLYNTFEDVYMFAALFRNIKVA